MTQEDKQLLLVDLCARLPYGIKVLYNEIKCIIENIGRDGSISLISDDSTHKKAIYLTSIEYIKPYLRPMSSITVEEKEELLIYVLDNKEDCKRFKINDEVAIESIDNNIFQWVYFDSDTTSRYIDWLNKKMLDYRGFIEKGAALEAPEGMYKEK